MKRFIGITVLFVLMMGIFTNAFSQDDNYDKHDISITIPEVALLDIEPSGNNTIALGVTAPTEAGDPVSFTNATNNSLWLNYSSIIGSTTEPNRKVTAKISSGTIPEGMVLKVVAAADAGQGDGTVGTAVGEITLTSADQDFITGIGSCYTGSPENKGHQLTYALELDSAAGSYANLDFDDETTITIVYTLSDN